jgi:hypothetical protein
MSAAFYKRRRGILEHIESGEIDLLESGIHDYLLLKANLLIGSRCSIPVGVCFSSAPAIRAHCRRVSERTIQRCLKHLEEIGWLKSWKTRGKRGNYPVLLCRASVHDLSGKEYRINGQKTIDWQHPVYEAVGEVSEGCLRSDFTPSGHREKREEKIEKRRQEEAPAPPSPSLPPVFTGQHFSVSQKQDALFGNAFPWVERGAEYRKADSWLEANPGKRPPKASRFLHNWFQRITEPKGKIHEKLTGSDLLRHNAKALGFTN